MAAKTIDANAPRFNQIGIVILVLTGFIFEIRILPALVGAILLLGGIFPAYSLFQLIYRRVIVPAGLLTPQIVEGDGAAHRFAEVLGGLTMAVASVAFLVGQAYIGWILSWVVVVLAGVNLAFGFCAGCFLYYQIQKHRTDRSTAHTQGI